MKETKREWTKAVKDAAGDKCQYCGTGERLEAHHLRPRCDFPDLALCVNNGVCLCHSCHVKAHGGTFFRPRGVANYIRPGKYTREEITAVQAFISSMLQTEAGGDRL